MLARWVSAILVFSIDLAVAQDLVGSPRILVEKDRKYATITLPTLPPTEIRVDGAQVDELIASLGSARAQLLPEQPHQILPGQGAVALFDPGWATQKLADGDSVLALRDPRYGWLNYKLPSASAEKLATTILNSQIPSK